MAKDIDIERRRAKPRDAMASYISVGALVSVLGGIWKIDDYVTKIVESRISVLKPSREHIQSICSELIKEEKKQSREEQKELREAIDWIMRYIGTERRK